MSGSEMPSLPLFNDRRGDGSMVPNTSKCPVPRVLRRALRGCVASVLSPAPAQAACARCVGQDALRAQHRLTHRRHPQKRPPQSASLTRPSSTSSRTSTRASTSPPCPSTSSVPGYAAPVLLRRPKLPRRANVHRPSWTRPNVLTCISPVECLCRVPAAMDRPEHGHPAGLLLHPGQRWAAGHLHARLGGTGE